MKQTLSYTKAGKDITGKDDYSPIFFTDIDVKV